MKFDVWKELYKLNPNWGEGGGKIQKDKIQKNSIFFSRDRPLVWRISTENEAALKKGPGSQSDTNKKPPKEWFEGNILNMLVDMCTYPSQSLNYVTLKASVNQ